MKRTFSGTIPCLGLTHAYILESKNSNGDKSNAHVHGTDAGTHSTTNNSTTGISVISLGKCINLHTKCNSGRVARKV